MIVNPGDPITADLFNQVASSIPKFGTISNDIGFITAPDGTILLNQWNKLIAAPASASKSGLKPFALRWMNTSATDPDVGEWQIYLPRGCAVLNTDTYCPKNDIGTDVNGDITFSWYKIPDPVDSDAEVTTKGNYVFKEWTVWVKFKDYPLMYAETKQNNTDFRTNASISVGSLSVKEWTDENGKLNSVKTTVQTYGSIYKRNIEETGSFRIVYECTGDRKQESSYKVKLTNQFITVGREQIWIQDDTDITEFTDVVLKIDHSNEKMSIEIVNKMADNTLDNTFLRILRMNDKTVLEDTRDTVRQPFNFYQN